MSEPSYEKARKEWVQPELKVYGTVEELTKKTWGSQDTFFQTISTLTGGIIDINAGYGTTGS